MKHIILSAMLLIAVSAHAQQRQWQASFGGDGNEDAMAVIETSDGGFLLAGMTVSYRGNPFARQSGYVVKTDAEGNREWEQYYGSDIVTTLHAVLERPEGYVLFGRSSANFSDPYDIYIATIDRDGNVLSEKTIIESTDDYVGSVLPTGDGGYMLLVYGEMIRLYKLSSDFSIEWQKSYPGRTAHGLQQTSDGGFVFTGATFLRSPTREDVQVIRTDARGDTLWTQTAGSDVNDEGFAVKETPGGFLVAALMPYAQGGAFPYMLSLDHDGTLKGIDTGADLAYYYAARPGPGESFYFLGTTFDGEYKALMLQIDTSGRRVGGISFGIGEARSLSFDVQPTRDGGYVFAGREEFLHDQLWVSDALIGKFSGAASGVEDTPQQPPAMMDLSELQGSGDTILFDPMEIRRKGIFEREGRMVRKKR